MNLPETLPLFINGNDVVTSNLFQTINPYSEQVITNVSIAGTEEVELAVASAKKAQRCWAQRSAKERAKILLKTAEILRRQNDELARIESEDTGRPIRETKVVDIVSATDCLEYIASLIQVHSSRHIPLGNGSYAYTLNQPLGVCVGIGAWNYPLQIATWKSAPALACGNAFIFKPSEMTPISAYYLAKAYKEAGLPDGLFQVLQGPGEVGKKLVEHPGIAKVSLTGSVPTGQKIYESCASGIKKLSLELGGKSPLIVFDDADLDDAVQGTLLANFYSQGEICSNGTRVFLHEKIKKDFEEKLISEVRKIKLGDPLDPATHMGPLISKQHKEKVLNYIEKARSQGANFLYEENNATGNFVSPTVLSNCSDEMTCSKDEIFGPVVSLFSFDSEVEVVQRANATDFGLAGAVYTQNIERAHRVAANLEVGTTWINAYNLTPVEMPFGGAKMSGLGMENGHEVLAEYSRTQSIFVKGAENPNTFF